MPGSWTDFADNAILDFLFGRVPLIPPKVFWIGLSTQKATKDGRIVEPPASANYGRMGLPNQPLVWRMIDRTTRANALAIPFPAPTAPWGLVISMFLADAQYGGRIWKSADFDVPRLVQPPQPGPIIQPGMLVIGGA